MRVLGGRLIFTGIVGSLASSCGGGSGSSPGATYSYVLPTPNSQRLYTRTLVDNMSNTLVQSVQDTVLSVSSSGFVESSEDPNHETIVVGGTNYSIQTEQTTFNLSGQDTSYIIEYADLPAVTCTLAPHGVGPTYPISVGSDWTLTYTVSCMGYAPVSYTQNGSVIDVESVSVPAGTFSAVKLQSTIVWTTANGLTHREALTTWRDAANGHSVKEVLSFTYTGTLPDRSLPVSETLELQSQS